jgi:glycosyltransferase involved in cell wall biosynthesis
MTGYARVGRFIAKTLVDAGYEIFYLPCNADFEPKIPVVYPYTIYPFDPSDRYFVNRFFNIVNQIQPSLVMAIGEFGFVGHVSSYTKDMGVKSLYYMPVEGRNYPPAESFEHGKPIDLLVRIAKFDYVVAWTEFGKQEISKLLPGVVTAVVPLQVDTKVFRPLDKKECLKVYIPPKLLDLYGWEKLFIVGSICRNQRRKGTDYVMKGFSKFLEREDPKNNKVAVLLMVTDQYDVQGYNFRNLIELYNLKGRVLHYPNDGGLTGVPDNGLVELYNCMDVNLCPFRGGGWEMQCLESLACGVKTIATQYASPAEYGKDVFTFIKPYDYEPQLGTNCEWAVLRAQDIADKIYEHYSANDTKTVYDKGVELANKFSEEAVAKQWVELINSFNLKEMRGGAPVEKEQLQDYQDTVISRYLEMIE